MPELTKISGGNSKSKQVSGNSKVVELDAKKGITKYNLISNAINADNVVNNSGTTPVKQPETEKISDSNNSKSNDAILYEKIVNNETLAPYSDEYVGKVFTELPVKNMMPLTGGECNRKIFCNTK